MKHREPAAARPSSPIVESLENRRHLSADVTITTARAQTIDGFGTSLGGSTDLGVVLSPKFEKAYYQDFGASVFRVAMNPWLLAGPTKNGVSIGSPVYLGPNVADNAAKFDFYNRNINKYGQMARAAAKYGKAVKLIGSVWSPPFWMKGEEVNPSTGKPNGVQPTFDDNTGNTSGGSLVDTEANLTQFGRYVAAYVYGFQKAFGVKLYAISIQNELAFHEGYSSAVYDPTLYVKALKTVRRWLNEYGLDTKIIGPEDVGVGSTTNTGILNRQMAYVKAVRKDADASNALDVYAIHGYANDGTTVMRSPEMWGRYWNGYDGTNAYNSFTGIKADHKPSWMTETSGYSNTWDGVLRLASGITDALVQGDVSAYVYWGISNTTNSGESLMKNADYASGKYNAFKHFSKYVRPNAVRLETSKTDPTGVYVSAFADDAHKTLTSVLVNNHDVAEDVTLHVGGTGVSRFGTVVASVEGKAWKTLTAYKVSGGAVTFTMPARSIFTLVGSTVAGAAARRAAGSISGVYFLDTNKNGRQDKTEQPLAGDKVFLDLNANGTRDRHEPTAVTNKTGAFTFAGLAAGVYRVRRAVVGGWSVTTPPGVSRVNRLHLAVGGVAIGVARTSTPTPPSSGGASISGHAFADNDANGRQNGNEADAVAKTIFLDANNDGRLDADEVHTTTDSHGDFSFTGLRAGTYRVRRVYSTGYTASVATTPITLTSGEHKTGLLLGSERV